MIRFKWQHFVEILFFFFEIWAIWTFLLIDRIHLLLIESDISGIEWNPWYQGIQIKNFQQMNPSLPIFAPIFFVPLLFYARLVRTSILINWEISQHAKLYHFSQTSRFGVWLKCQFQGLTIKDLNELTAAGNFEPIHSRLYTLKQKVSEVSC